MPESLLEHTVHVRHRREGWTGVALRVDDGLVEVQSPGRLRPWTAPWAELDVVSADPHEVPDVDTELDLTLTPPALNDGERINAASARLLAAAAVKGLHPLHRSWLISMGASLHMAAVAHRVNRCAETDCTPVLLADVLLGLEVRRA